MACRSRVSEMSCGDEYSSGPSYTETSYTAAISAHRAQLSIVSDGFRSTSGWVPELDFRARATRISRAER